MPSDKAQADAAHDLEPLSCVACRSRKLRCDRSRGTCRRCVKLDHECVYPESRRKPTYKRRNVKELEARLAQVEDYLSKEANGKGAGGSGSDAAEDAAAAAPHETGMQLDFGLDVAPPGHLGVQALPGAQSDALPMPFTMPDFDERADFPFGGSGELMGLGMSEPPPPFNVQEELNTAFFSVSHHLIPVVHPGRYYQAFYGSAVRKPPMCLQYAIWALGAHQHDKYGQYAEIFYERARQYADADEMKGVGEYFITIPHAQTWAIVASYEARNMLFTRASMAMSRCVRLVNMMGLDRIDDEDVELPPALAPATSWAELEERRRVFWGVFAIDSHATISTGWPSLINSDDVMTRLPSSEEAFILDQEEKTCFLDDVFSGAPYSAFAGTILICHIFKTILHHVYRRKPRDHPDDLINGPFWERHRDLDNKLSGLFMFLPERFRLPQGARDPAAVHTNLNLHASLICLHHAAIEMAEKHSLPESVKRSSVGLLRASAEAIVNIVKMTSHHATIFKSPLCALSLYSATTVYVYMAKDADSVSEASAADIANLELIIQAMDAFGRAHEMTRAFLKQACLDIEHNDLRVGIALPDVGDLPGCHPAAACHSIPLLARGQVARHAHVHSTMPGRPPDGVPVHAAFNSKCFQPMLSAANRNVAAPASRAEPADDPGGKRKRASPSPAAPDLAPGLGAFGEGGSGAACPLPDMQRQYEKMAPSLVAPGLWRAGGLSIRVPSSTASSSPARGTGTATDTLSGGSSHTSPCDAAAAAAAAGLGATPEENRVDLRGFQDRIATPVWESTEEALLGQLADPMGGGGGGGGSAALQTEGNDGWGLLTGEINWNAMPAAMAGQPGSSSGN